MKKIILTFFLILLAPAGWAACADPVGEEGSMVYNTSFKVMQFCNGTNWVSMASSFSNIPSGFIGSFDLASCPDGWSEYTLARGRFLRGIDSTGTVDPDGVRAAGNQQGDGVGPHKHQIVDDLYDLSAGGYDANSGVNAGIAQTLISGPNGREWQAGSIVEGGESETRPKNVAVLYCEKD